MKAIGGGKQERLEEPSGSLSEGEREGGRTEQRTLSTMPVFLRKVLQGHHAVLQANFPVRKSQISKNEPASVMTLGSL